MTQPDDVSVVVRNYNRGARLQRALRSVLDQHDVAFELILVDDASTDDSVALAMQTCGDDPRLRVIPLPHNVGAGEAANVGVAAARTPLVAFLDSDDSWHPDFLLAQLRALDDAPSAALSYCDYIEVWDGYDQERPMLCGSFQDQRAGMLRGGCIHSMSMTVVRRRAIEVAGGFDPRYRISHDFALWLRLALIGHQPFVHVHRPLVRHHRSADGVTTDHQRWLDEYREALQAGFEAPEAEGYQALKAEGLHNVAVGIVTRRKVAEWLQRTNGALVSVLLRARGGYASVTRALACIEAQSYRNFEVVVIDASGDEALAQALAERSETLGAPHMRHLQVDEASSGAALFNLGLAAAAGELIAVLDDHEQWAPEFLQAQVRAHSYVVGTPALSFCDVRTPAGTSSRAAPRTSDLLLDCLQHPYLQPLSSLVMRRDHLLAARPGLNDALDHGEAAALVLSLLSGATPAEQPTHVRHPPVHVRRALLESPGHWRPGADAATARADLGASLLCITNSFLDSKRGSAYRFIDDQILAAQNAALAAL